MKGMKDCVGRPGGAILTAESATEAAWEARARELGAITGAKTEAELANALFPDPLFWEHSARQLEAFLGPDPIAFAAHVQRLAEIQAMAAILHHRITCIASNGEGASLQAMYEAAQTRRCAVSLKC